MQTREGQKNMDVIISECKGSKIYHRPGCHYVEHISPIHRLIRSEKKVIRKGYCACKYCGGPDGLHRINRKALREAVAESKMVSFYDDTTSTFYIRTDIGFWKFFWKDESEGYLLYHLSTFDSNLSSEDLMHRHFHRQRDFSVTESMESIIKYIEAHDKAKKIIADDYRKLPKTTKKKKNYYKSAKKKAMRQESDRVDRLFALIASHAANSIILST